MWCSWDLAYLRSTSSCVASAVMSSTRSPPAATLISPSCGAFAKPELASRPIRPISSSRRNDRRTLNDRQEITAGPRMSGLPAGRKPFGDLCPFNLRHSYLMHRTLPIIALTALALAACAGGDLPSQPSFYQNLAAPNAQVDPTPAQSMISGSRQNNGLGPVAVDPALMRLASEQSRAMAQRDKLDPNPPRSFTDPIHPCGLPGEGGGRECRRRLPHAGRGIPRLARFTAAPRQHAQARGHPHGHRGRLCTELEIQGVLDADHGGA